jgi:ribosome-binding protein aMBF1 (putative translation factor)
MGSSKPIRSAGEILRRCYIGDDPERLASLEEERLHAKVARQIYDLRIAAGPIQSQLAEKVNTTQSVISRLEDADYEGHSLSMLQKIVGALGVNVELDFVEAEQAVEPKLAAQA